MGMTHLKGNMRLKFDDRILSDKQVKEMSTVLKASCETLKCPQLQKN